MAVKTNKSASNIDFKYKIGTFDFTLRDAGRGYYGIMKGNIFARAVHEKYSEKKDMSTFWSYAKDLDKMPINHNVGNDKFPYALLQEMLVSSGKTWSEFIVEFESSTQVPLEQNIIKKLYPDYELDSYAPSWQLQNAMADFGVNCAQNSPEAVELNTEFKKWLKKRPGVKDTYIKYSEEKGRSITDAEEITFHDVARAYSSWDFKHLLEVSRPVVYAVGSLVCLRRSFYNTYRHDPYYYCKSTAFDVPKDEVPRMGIVTEITNRCASRSKYGKGSRMLKVMWSATGESTMLSENKLILAEKYKVGEET